MYGTAMTACVRRGEHARAWRLAQRARAGGVQLNALECNIALGAAARCGDLDGALGLLSDMRTAADPACRPDVGSYDALLVQLIRAGRNAEVLEAFDELQAAWPSLTLALALAPAPTRTLTPSLNPQP